MDSHCVGSHWYNGKVPSPQRIFKWRTTVAVGWLHGTEICAVTQAWLWKVLMLATTLCFCWLEILFIIILNKRFHIFILHLASQIMQPVLNASTGQYSGGSWALFLWLENFPRTCHRLERWVSRSSELESGNGYMLMGYYCGNSSEYSWASRIISIYD